MSAEDLRAAILALADWFEEEYGVIMSDEEFDRAEVEAADEATLRVLWNRTTWTVAMEYEDGSEPSVEAAGNVAREVWPGGEFELVGGGMFNITLPPRLALDLMRDGYVEASVGDVSVWSELP